MFLRRLKERIRDRPSDKSVDDVGPRFSQAQQQYAGQITSQRQKRQQALNRYLAQKKRKEAEFVCVFAQIVAIIILLYAGTALDYILKIKINTNTSATLSPSTNEQLNKVLSDTKILLILYVGLTCMYFVILIVSFAFSSENMIRVLCFLSVLFIFLYFILSFVFGRIFAENVDTFKSAFDDHNFHRLKVAVDTIRFLYLGARYTFIVGAVLVIGYAILNKMSPSVMVRSGGQRSRQIGM